MTPAELARSGGDAGRSGDDIHAWVKAMVGWHIAFWTFLGLALLRLLTAGDLHTGPRLVGLAVVAVLALAYLGLRPTSPVTPDLRTNVYLGLVVVGVGVAIAVDPVLSLLLFIAYSQMWMFSSGVLAGSLLSLLLTLSALCGFLTNGGWSRDMLYGIAPTIALSLVCSMLMGIWISRIIEQSRGRAQLISELEAAQAELSTLSHAQGVMAERERMAREIHDTLAQGYTSVIMLAQAAQISPDPAKLELIETVARENLAEARALVAAFSPVELEGRTLVDAVRRLVSRFGAETSVPVTLSLPPSLAGLSRDREVVLLRSVQEALANVRRHACAGSVQVRVTTSGPDPSVKVEVVDDGVGFASPTAGFGLTGMRWRVEEAGGSLDVASTPGAGTRVVVRLPA